MALNAVCFQCRSLECYSRLRRSVPELWKVGLQIVHMFFDPRRHNAEASQADSFCPQSSEVPFQEGQEISDIQGRLFTLVSGTLGLDVN